MTADLEAPFSLIDLGTVGSTNDTALALAQDGAPAWSVVRAERQTAGRGRRGRAFQSPPGNSYTSFLLRPVRPAREVPQLALVAGLAVAEAVDRFAPELPRATCKWPNDVLVDGLKVAGILVEASSGRKLEAVVVGIGVNLVDHPASPGMRASDLASLGAVSADRNLWLRVLCKRLFERTGAWEREGFAAMRDSWMARAAGLGQCVQVAGELSVRGLMTGVDGEGALLVDEDGVTRRCVSGSLVLKEFA